MGESGLGLSRPRRKHLHPASTRVLHACTPKGRLTDPRFAFEDEQRGAALDPGEEVPEGGELGVTPHDRSGHCRPIVRLRDASSVRSGWTIVHFSDLLTQSRANIWR